MQTARGSPRPTSKNFWAPTRRLNSFGRGSSILGMGTVRAGGLCSRVAVVALLLVTVLAVAVRPLLRGAGHSHSPWGLNRLVLLSEPAVNDDAPLVPPICANVHLVPLALAVPLLLLKMHRRGFTPVPVRRLKLFSRCTSSSLPSH